MKYGCFYALLFIGLLTPTARADDWPQWLGPQRDSTWNETGVLQEFPAEGPPVKFRVPVGSGYAGPAVAGEKLFVFDYERTAGDVKNSPSTRDELEGNERLLCLHADTGKLLWKHEQPRKYSVSYGSGPRCTPTVDVAAGRVYTLGAMGDLTCLNVADGSVVWHRLLTDDYKTGVPIWGFAAHPLVAGDALYCVVGGPGSVAVAFNKHTGEELWKALTVEGEPGYCPPSMIHQAGVEQLIIWHAKVLNSLNPATGEVYWTEELAPSYSMAIAMPRKFGDFLFAGGIGHVGALYRLGTEKPTAEVVWRGTAKTAVYPSNVTPVIDDGIIYGCDCQTGELIAARLNDGERLWATTAPTAGVEVRRPNHGTAFLVKQTDCYYLMSETGDLIIAQLSAAGYEEVSRFHVLEATGDSFGRPVVWSHPAMARRCVYARNDKEVVCVDVSTK